MDAVVQSILSGAPILVLHLVTALAVLALGVSIYMWVTPYEDIRLVRTCLAGSVTTLYILLGGCVTLVIQIAAFRGVDLILKGLGRRIETGEMSAAIFLVFVKLSVAVIVAAGVHR